MDVFIDCIRVHSSFSEPRWQRSCGMWMSTVPWSFVDGVVTEGVDIQQRYPKACYEVLSTDTRSLLTIYMLWGVGWWSHWPTSHPNPTLPRSMHETRLYFGCGRFLFISFRIDPLTMRHSWWVAPATVKQPNYTWTINHTNLQLTLIIIKSKQCKTKRFNTEMSPYQYRKSYYGENDFITVLYPQWDCPYW